MKAVLDGGFPEASFQATLNACAKRLPTPVVYLEATLAHKKEVKRRLQTPSLFGDEAPPGELRAVKVVPNEAAQQEGFIDPDEHAGACELGDPPTLRGRSAGER